MPFYTYRKLPVSIIKRSMLMDLQLQYCSLQAGFTESESRFGLVIRMHFFTESETRFSVNPNPYSIIEYAMKNIHLVVPVMLAQFC